MGLMTRRELLENSMLAAAAAVTLGGTNSLFAEDKQSGSPNEKLRIAVVGVNSRGGEHLSQYLARKDVEVVAICDTDTDVGMSKGVARVAKESGKKPAFFQDLRKMLDASNGIDCVSIATPNHWHALAAIWSIQAGKDVYVEKPVSHNVSEGRRIVEAARKYGKICQTGTQCRSMGATIEAVDYAKSGEIGEVKVARGLCYKPRGSIGPRGTYEPPKSVDYDVWCGPAPMHALTRPKFHYDWHWQWDYGNGDLGNQGIHQMDIARWGLGVDDVGGAVLSYGGRFAYTDAGETANSQVSIHDYGDKTLVFEVRGLKTDAYKTAGVGVIFEGTDGYVVLTSYDRGAAFDKNGNKVKEFSAQGDHFGNFIDAVRSRKVDSLKADILEGHLSSALCHLGNISYRLGETVTVAEARERLGAMKQKAEATETFDRFLSHLTGNGLDAEKLPLTLGAALTLDAKAEVFTGAQSDKANTMLSREYRKGFEVPTSFA